MEIIAKFDHDIYSFQNNYRFFNNHEYIATDIKDMARL